MTILPLIGRQLRVRARSPAVYWTRFGAALAGSTVCLTTLSGAVWGTPVGAVSFEGLVAASFVLCCLSGLLTVDGISRERREGTLGLLLLTRVRALDVLLGNFGAAGMASLSALAALTPVLILPLLVGGLTGGEAARKVLALFDTMILSLAAGLWASAGGRAAWSCVGSAGRLVLLLILGPLLMESLFPFYLHLQPWWPGPLNALGAANDRRYQLSAAPYWCSIAVVHAISWLLVIAAGRRLRRALCEDDETPARTVKAAPRREPLAVGEAPLEWLVRRRNDVMPLVWAGVFLGLALYSGLLFIPEFMWRILTSSSSWGMRLAIAVAEGCLFGWTASRFFIEARRSGELELVLTTPEGARTIVTSQWKWLKDLFTGPLAVFVIPWVILSFIDDMQWGLFSGSALIPPSFGFFSILSQLVSCVISLVGILALLRTGMWLGWSLPSQIRAVSRIVLLAKGVPYVIGMVGFLAIQEFSPIIMQFSGQSRSLLMLVWSTPHFVILLFYIGLIRWATRRIAGESPHARTGFRVAAFIS